MSRVIPVLIQAVVYGSLLDNCVVVRLHLIMRRFLMSYSLSDGSVMWIGSPDMKGVIYITHKKNDGSSVDLFRRVIKDSP